MFRHNKPYSSILHNLHYYEAANRQRMVAESRLIREGLIHSKSLHFNFDFRLITRGLCVGAYFFLFKTDKIIVYYPKM